ASDVAHGLQFLHEHDILHGDLKGSNVFINSSQRACLADFGLASASDIEVLSWASLSSYTSKCGSVRWQAPELFDPDAADELHYATKATDIYAWGSVAYEIFAGQLPFAHVNRDPMVMTKIMNGERPTRPTESSPSWNVWGLTEAIWSLMERCWDADPAQRPTVDLVLDIMDESLPQKRSEVVDDSLSPAQFRAMTRGAIDENELSVETLDSLLSAEQVHG
ncbi:hypothetical protein H0H92_003436, partial [Tricholoma furcatifolium]